MADHGIPDHRVEFVERICDGEDSMAERTGGIATFWRLLDNEDNVAQFLRHLERFYLSRPAKAGLFAHNREMLRHLRFGPCAIQKPRVQQAAGVDIPHRREDVLL